jgi:hypothetical protein
MALDVEILEESFDLVAPQGDELVGGSTSVSSRSRPRSSRSLQTSTWTVSGRRF